MSDYEKQATRIEEEVMKFHNDESGWKVMKSQREMVVSYRPSPHFSGALYKFEGEIDAPDEVVYNVMRPPLTTEERLSWDKSIKDYQCLKQINEDLIIGRIVTHPAMMGMISMREFIDLYYFRRQVPCDNADYDRVSWILAESIELPERPVTKEYVRAKNFPNGYAVARCRNDHNKCKLILYVNADIGGMLPRSLVEAALPSQQISYIKSVKAQVNKILGR